MEIIAEWGTVLLIMAVVFGLYMTWGIGANDVANAMGTSVGSGAITVMQAIIIAAIFEFAGAFLAGGTVTSTIRKGIIDAGALGEGQPELLVYGMLASLLAAGIWLMIAAPHGAGRSPRPTPSSVPLSASRWPGIGMDAVKWDKIGQIAASWVVSPLIGGVLHAPDVEYPLADPQCRRPVPHGEALGAGLCVPGGLDREPGDPVQGAQTLNLELTTGQSFIAATVFGIGVALVGKVLIDRVKVDAAADRTVHYASVEKVFTPMMIFTACAMAFAHGSNDVANGIGPMAAVVSTIQHGGEVAQKGELPLWILLLGGFGIVVGLSRWATA